MKLGPRWIVRAAVGVPLLIAAACGDARPRVVVVLASAPPERIALAEEAFERENPDIEARMLRVTPAEALERIVDDGAREQADVWWGAPPETLAAAVGSGRLVAVHPSWAADAFVSDPEGRWHALPSPPPFVIAFNVEELTRSRAPQDWIDLFHQRWVEELVLLDPERDARMRSLFGGLMLEELRRTGDENAAFDFLRGLEVSTLAYERDVDEVLRRLRGGDASMTLLPLDVVEAARADGRPWLEHRRLESGSPAAAEGIALLSGADDREAALAFVELAGRFAPTSAEEAGGLWPPSPDTLAARIDGWIERWGLEIRGKSRRAY